MGKGLQTNSLNQFINEWRSLRRICNWILGLKGENLSSMIRCYMFSESQMPKFSVFCQLAQRIKLSPLITYRAFFDIADLICVHGICHMSTYMYPVQWQTHKKGGSRLVSYINNEYCCSRTFDRAQKSIIRESGTNRFSCWASNF